MSGRGSLRALQAGAAATWVILACAHPVDEIETPSTPARGGSAQGGAGKGGASGGSGRGGASTAAGSGGARGGQAGTAGRGGGGAGGAGGDSLAEAGSPEQGSGGESGVVVPAELEVKHKTGSGDANDNQIRVGLRIASAAADSVALSSLELRYYFTSEVALPLVIELYDASITGTSGYRTVGKDAVQAEVTSADSYLRLSFTKAAGELLSGDAISLDVTVHGQNWTGNFSEADDYSFAADHAEFTAWDRVTLFGEEQLIWGKEPP